MCCLFYQTLRGKGLLMTKGILAFVTKPPDSILQQTGHNNFSLVLLIRRQLLLFTLDFIISVTDMK